MGINFLQCQILSMALTRYMHSSIYCITGVGVEFGLIFISLQQF
jgi:hypothetical protein